MYWELPPWHGRFVFAFSLRNLWSIKRMRRKQKRDPEFGFGVPLEHGWGNLQLTWNSGNFRNRAVKISNYSCHGGRNQSMSLETSDQFLSRASETMSDAARLLRCEYFTACSGKSPLLNACSFLSMILQYDSHLLAAKASTFVSSLL